MTAWSTPRRRSLGFAAGRNLLLGGNRLGAFTHDRLGQNRSSRGAVTSNVVGLGSDLTDHLGAHVLELVIELDFLGDRHTVLGDTGRAEGLVQNHGTALGTQRDLDSVGQNVDAAQHARACIRTKLHVFSSHVVYSPVCLLLWMFVEAAQRTYFFLAPFLVASMTPMMSDSFMIRSS